MTIFSPRLNLSARHGWRWLLPLFLILSLLLVPTVQAQDDDEDVAAPAGLEIDARGGFDGFYKRDQWVPITIELSNDGPAIDGVLRAVVGRPNEEQVVYETPIALPTQSQKRVTTFVYFPDFSTSLNVVLREGNETIAQSRITDLSQVAPDAMLYGILSDEPGELEFLERVTGDRQSAQVAFLELADLPDSASGWRALDVLVLNDVDTGRMSDVQKTALEAWVNGGGQLVVTGGASWQQNSVGVQGLLPVRLTGSESFADLPGLSSDFGEVYRDDGPYVVTTSTLQDGQILYAEGSTPILAQRNLGRGNVFFLALDPKTAPLRDWDANEAFWEVIVRDSQQLPFWATGVKESFLIRDAVRNLSALALPSAWLLLCFLSLYVLAIGPINYFVLKRMGRRELAWVTIPALIIIFSLGSILTGFRTRGNEVIMNQLSVVHGQIDGDLASTQSTLGLYSPRRATYDLTLPPEALVRPLQDDFGGGNNANFDTIERSTNVTVTDVRVDVSATETFVIDTFQPLPNISGEVTLRVDSSGASLEIAVTNNSDITLENPAIVFGNELIDLDDLEPGDSATVTTILNENSAQDPTGNFTSFGGPSSPLTATRNEEIVFGEQSEFGRFDDPDTQSRFQLLQALHGNYYSGELVQIPQGIVTLMAWSTEPQVDVEITARSSDVIAQTVYFIELPLTQSLASTDNIEISQGLWTLEILNQSGLYNPYPYDLDLSNGWVEYEFTPWSEFQGIDVNGLDILLSLPAGEFYETQIVPDIRLWDWQEETWVEQQMVWGQNRIDEYDRYVNENGSVRISLSHTTFDTIRIRELQPILYGDL